MKRRDFIRYTSGAIATGSVLSSTQNFANIHPSQSANIIVVGAGVMGAWTAFYLQQQGAKVTLIDAYGPGNTRSSSGGETRILRADYGEKVIYTKMVVRAHELWDKWQKEWGRKLMYSTGRLSIGPADYATYANEAKRRLKPFGVNSEVLDRDEIIRRWPQLGILEDEIGLYDTGGAGGSTLLAREACRATTEKFIENGGTFIHAKALPGKSVNGQLDSIELSDGRSLRADQYIFAGGPWMGSIFPDVLSDKLKVFRRDVLFIGTPAGDPRFSYPNLPIWLFRGTRWYGFPDFHGRGLKAAPFPDYNSIDMDMDERLIHPIEIKRARDFVEQRFPALKNQPITEGRVCQLTFSSDEHFIVDTHPDNKNLWFACAGSGHAFKHGPAFGEYLSRRVLEGTQVEEYDNAFRLKGS
ncbi:MAG: FAD-dependent oxidoreductase [Cyclobacteriaceae bacterium]